MYAIISFCKLDIKFNLPITMILCSYETFQLLNKRHIKIQHQSFNFNHRTNIQTSGDFSVQEAQENSSFSYGVHWRRILFSVPVAWNFFPLEDYTLLFSIVKDNFKCRFNSTPSQIAPSLHGENTFSRNKWWINPQLQPMIYYRSGKEKGEGSYERNVQ
jgi:hypothetical protein